MGGHLKSIAFDNLQGPISGRNVLDHQYNLHFVYKEIGPSRDIRLELLSIPDVPMVFALPHL